jgi:Glycosyl transferase family 2
MAEYAPSDRSLNALVEEHRRLARTARAGEDAYSFASLPRFRYNHRHMPLTWALAIATYNRPEALRRSVLCAIDQTRPPCEIIIVDSSPSQPSSRQDIHDLVLPSGANVRVDYLRSPIAQQTIQRNLAIDASSADVLFMIDDGAYM